MQCANGHDLTDQQKFCPECGAPAVLPPLEDDSVEHTQILPMNPPNPAWMPPQEPPGGDRKGLSKQARWGVVAAVAIVVLGGGGATALLATRSNTTEPGVSTWMCTAGTTDLLLQWPDAAGTINGTYQESTLTGTAPDQHVSATHGDVTGQVAGNAITVNLDLRGAWYGSIHGNQMTLNIPIQDGTIQPLTCRPSTTAAWNETVASLGSQGASADASASAAAAQQQQAQDMANAQQSLASAIQQLATDSTSLETDKTLAGDIQTVKNDLATEQKDWAAEQTDSCSNISGDASTVSGDASSVDGDISSLTGDIDTINNSISAIQTDVSNIQSAAASVQSHGGTPQVGPSTALAAGAKAIADAKKAIAWATQQGNNLNNAAQAIAQQASDFANAHGC